MSGLNQKERQILIFTAVLVSFFFGCAAQALLNATDTKTAREWISAIGPTVGLLFGFIALLRAGRSLDLTRRQFSISQSVFLEQQINHRLLGDQQLEDFLPEIKIHFDNLMRIITNYFENADAAASVEIRNQLDDEFVVIRVKGDAIRKNINDHDIFTVLKLFNDTLIHLKRQLTSAMSSMDRIREAGGFVTIESVRGDLKEATLKMAGMYTFLEVMHDSYRREIASLLRKMHEARGTPIPPKDELSSKYANWIDKGEHPGELFEREPIPFEVIIGSYTT